MITHSFVRNGIPVELSFSSSEDHIAKQVGSASDFYEAELLDAISALLSAGDMVIDVGANVGNHSVYFSLILGCKVYSYEPNPEALVYLRANVQQNGVASSVNVIPLAVGKGKGKANVSVEVSGNLGALSLDVSDDDGRFDVIGLDGECFPEKVRLIKIDVEGMERAVVEGALDLIKRDRPYVVAEAATAAEFRDIDMVLVDAGYIPVAVFGSTATYLYSPAEKYTGVEKGLIIGMRRAVISNAELKSLVQAHRETRKTVIKHTQEFSEVRQRADTLALELEEVGGAIKDSLGKLREELGVEVGGRAHDIEKMAERLGANSFAIDEVRASGTVNSRAIAGLTEAIARNTDAILAGGQAIAVNAELIAENRSVLIEQGEKIGRVESSVSGNSEAIASIVEAISASRREAQEDRRLHLVSGESIRANRSALAEVERRLTDATKRLDVDVDSMRSSMAQQLDELNQRLQSLNNRHDALLNGRIFRTLTGIKSLLRGLGRKSERVHASQPSVTSEMVTPVVTAGPVPSSDAAVVGDGAGPVHIDWRPRMERRRSSLSAAGVVVPSGARVSVVMTTYNSAACVGNAIDSVLEQSHSDIELIIVDDASRDRTRSILWQKAKQDSRIRIIESAHNRGTYWSKNLGIVAATGHVITFMDSDDMIDRYRIQKQLQAIHDGKVGSTCNYVRKNPDGEVVLNRGLEQRIGLITLMLKREVFTEIGYFDSVRTSADDEMVQRVKMAYGARSIMNVPEPLYVALLRENSLTTDAGNATNLGETEAASFLSAARAQYVHGYRLWHGELASRNMVPYVPFPNTNRPFDVAAKLRVSALRFEGQQVMAFMASFPPRIEKLKLAVSSLLPQVDRLYIYLNGYESVPEFLHDDRIVVHVGGKDLRDNGKMFHMVSAPDGYFFTVDDDICYPPDYCEHLVRAIERHDRKAIVGVHGVILANPFVRYFSPDRTVYSFKHALKRDTRVNLLGTGTVAFHSATIRPALEQFGSTGMADVWMAILAKNSATPMMAVARSAGWLHAIAMAGESEPTLYDEFRENDSAQTEILKAAGSWEIN